MRDVGKDEYRDAMARLGAAVSVITTDGPAGRTGFTASAVCSVTDAPPTLLVCVNRASAAHGCLLKNRTIAVNVLRAKDEDLSRHFSSKVPASERFAAASWSVLQTGAPVLENAVVTFDCRVASIHGVGTHDVFYCEVVAIRRNDDEEAALLYYNRRYHEVGKVLKSPDGDFEIIEWQ